MVDFHSLILPAVVALISSIATAVIVFHMTLIGEWIRDRRQHLHACRTQWSAFRTATKDYVTDIQWQISSHFDTLELSFLEDAQPRSVAAAARSLEIRARYAYLGTQEYFDKVRIEKSARVIAIDTSLFSIHSVDFNNLRLQLATDIHRLHYAVDVAMSNSKHGDRESFERLLNALMELAESAFNQSLKTLRHGAIASLVSRDRASTMQWKQYRAQAMSSILKDQPAYLQSCVLSIWNGTVA